MLDMFSNAAKAWISATLAAASAYVAAKWGFQVSGEVQAWLSAAIWGAVSGYLTYIIPNKS